MIRHLLFILVHYRTLLFSLLFATILVLIRALFTGSSFYGFLIWNLFLAALPYILTQTMFWYPYKKIKNRTRSILFLIWLSLIPNAPYIITDLIHLHNEYSFWKWFDLFIVFVFAYNGLILGILSLIDVFKFLCDHLQERWALFSVFGICLLSGYGVYVGRFLRFNSWDIVAQPHLLSNEIILSLGHSKVWLMTFAFGTFFWMVFSVLRWVKE
ncbi:DUF1361 domain-containing protein [Flagellimonas hymeniacidonis]|uniref:DUF1361 domain-containing protein n=1 Tax=Flagellimonas hymeniacidonis TaxID=2603628 RepID=A0A5C8V199_9FLAO|nr:DUF1361 domain-containing protein [Flagellimonas hymeniacidonis]TXN34862.1 DUF1361 domain-containing protein [Flagellimonas hymeniacidonis]